ncbi:MAG: hypothetical protein ABI543_13815 [Ignavibacteria bacterium]
MKKVLIIALFISSLQIFSQLVKENETMIFSFKTKSGKTAVLCRGSNESYIVYRFGTNKNVELEYPASLDNTSWQKFTYSYYFRGGGKKNAGQDLNYVSFQNNGYNYEIYDEYYSEDESTDAGIIVTDTDKNDTIIKAIKNSAKGSLVELRYNDKIQQEK